MKKLFTILLVLFAINLFAQDSVEVKRIDSFIANGSLIRDKEFTATESFPNLQCLHCMNKTEYDKTINYHFIDKKHIFKVSHIWHNKNDTGQITSYYFENKKLIKVETLVQSKLNRLEKVHSIYYKNNIFIYSDQLDIAYVNTLAYSNRAKRMLKKARHLSLKSYY